MSEWRDIWRYSVIANRFMSEDYEIGKKAFDKLFEVYGKDGMINYTLAESYENRKENELAIKHYKIAEKKFPVEHWKKLARDSYSRLSSEKTAEEFYGIKEDYKPTDEYFNNTLWYAYQKVYGYTFLNDFARYVCLSALARGSSEWPLSLVDFRTVLELEIKQCFPNYIKKEEEGKETKYYSLFETINQLYEEKIISPETKKAFNSIRIAGNIAAHNLYSNDEFKIDNVLSFIALLKYFNKHIEEKCIKISDNIEYPLCQITIEDFIDKLNKEKENLK